MINTLLLIFALIFISYAGLYVIFVYGFGMTVASWGALIFGVIVNVFANIMLRSVGASAAKNIS